MLSIVLLIVALVLFACVAFNKLSSRLGVPTLLAFILLGMAFGTDGIVKIPFDNYGFTEQICSTALVFIMFYGGFGTSWQAAKPVAKRSLLLSTLGVVATALLTGVFCHFALGLGWLEGLLIGSVLGSTDAASVFSILRARQLALKENSASLLEVESGSNDPAAYMLTTIVLTAMQGGVTLRSVVGMLAAQVLFGVAFGVAIGLGAMWALKRLQFGDGFDTIFVLAVAVISYALPAVLGGNGYLSTYLTGILLGNSDIRNKKTLVPFFDGITNLAQVVLFFLLGLLCTPSQMPAMLPTALYIALFLSFVARPAAVFALLAPFKASLSQKLLVSWAGLRGASSIVFAVTAVTSPAHTNDDIFHTVFLVVLFSISLQGTLLPFVAEKLNMVDTDADAMKIFTDYVDEVPVQFVQLTMTLEHPWSGKALREVVLPPGTVLVSLRRGERQIVPQGGTVLRRGDVLVLCARAPSQTDTFRLTERRLAKDDLANGSRVCDLPRRKDSIIMLVRRGDDILIPSGDTVLQPGDTLVVHHQDT